MTSIGSLNGSIPVSTPSFFTPCGEKKLGVETGNEAIASAVTQNLTLCLSDFAGISP